MALHYKRNWMGKFYSKTVDARSKFDWKNLTPYLESSKTLDESKLHNSEISELDLLTRT